MSEQSSEESCQWPGCHRDPEATVYNNDATAVVCALHGVAAKLEGAEKVVGGVHP